MFRELISLAAYGRRLLHYGVNHVNFNVAFNFVSLILDDRRVNRACRSVSE